MLRYLLAATAIVLATLAVLLALPHAARVQGDSRYSSSTGTPGPFQRDERASTASPVTGDAPWALSALPECFRQLVRSSGTLAYVRRHIPPDARRVAAGMELRVADCTIAISSDAADVSRGENLLHVPAPAHFYVTATHVLLERPDGAHAELRTFALRDGRVPRVVRRVP